MQQPRVRLIFNPSLGTREKRAALHALHHFANRGVVYDCIDAGPSTKELRRVRRGYAIRRIVLDAKPVVMPADLLYEPFMAAFFRKDIYGIGFTPHELTEISGPQEKTIREPRIGVSVPGAGAVVSVAAIRELEGQEALDAIGAATRHELGHVFGISGHCTDGSCIMRGNRDFADFVENMVRKARAFCRECEAKMGRFLQGPHFP